MKPKILFFHPIIKYRHNECDVVVMGIVLHRPNTGVTGTVLRQLNMGAMETALLQLSAGVMGTVQRPLKMVVMEMALSLD